jgi:hypothetical protein
MVVTWDGGLCISRIIPQTPLGRSEDDTVRVKVAKAS